jgi:hypothetical protein
MVDIYNDSECVLMSFISRSLLLLWNLSIMYADNNEQEIFQVYNVT